MTKPQDAGIEGDVDEGRAGISRRTWLSGAALTMAVGATFMVPMRAEAKTSQKEAMYQDSPKGSSKCGTCAQFQPPDACKLVEGKVSENGWCQLYTPKS